MKFFDYALKALLLILIGLYIVGFAKYVRDQSIYRYHWCEYKLCPYKGMDRAQFVPVDSEPGSDCAALDSLHLVYPKASYDELDSILFTPRSGTNANETGKD